MISKRAFMVIGPESSGTRFMTSLLISAGCSGQSTHEQLWDSVGPTGDQIVWRRSLPHGLRDQPDRYFVPLASMSRSLQEQGYEVIWVVMVRDPMALVESQVGPHVDTQEQALKNIQWAYSYLESQARDVQGLRKYYCTYESLVTSTDFSARFFEHLGLRKVDYELRNENEKYYRPKSP